MISEERRRIADRLRSIPLESVLRLLGARRDPRDRAKWHTARGVISVNGAKFMNWTLGAGGGGAIDLAMQVGGWDFKAALAWLSEHFSLFAPSEPPRRTERLELALPPRDDGKLPRLRRYLFQERRLPECLIEPLIARGTLYADSRSNAVFVLLGEGGNPVGAEIRGTTSRPWRAMAPGSRKDLGYFSVGDLDPGALVLCESAIDAVSCLALHPSTLCLSTAGARANPRWLRRLLESGKPVYCGFDADATGDAMARAMVEAHPNIQRLRPALKDWNDVLRSRV